MLIKEYRIPMPLSVDEYRIAQLYMIQKKSREESQGTESGVEIIENVPYSNGPGGSGQHTQKVYHISKHIPGWLVAILPKNALIVEEEAWNAYPYTRTRYTCPFVEKFSIDIETRYIGDVGETENIFDVTPTELRNTVVDEIDIVKEKASDYTKEEDPKLYRSHKTGRGPLNEDWLTELKSLPPSSRGKVMCAYKRCKVEFKYWGMQTKIEKFIHDIGLRKVMLRAHKQAWCWQDEWDGLTIEDIRKLERETQLVLRQKFGANETIEEAYADSDISLKESEDEAVHQRRISAQWLNSDRKARHEPSSSLHRQNSALKKLLVRKSSNTSLLSNKSKLSIQDRSLSQMSFQEGRIEGIRRYSTDASSDDEEFFDAQEEQPQNSSFSDLESAKSYSWNSFENLSTDTASQSGDVHERGVMVSSRTSSQVSGEGEIGDQEMSNGYPLLSCRFNILFLVLHGGNALESSHQGMQSNKQSDLQTLKGTFDNVINTHYKAAKGRIAIRLVSCPAICNETYQLLQSLSPSGHDRSISAEQTLQSALVSLFATQSPRYQQVILSLALSCNVVYNSFVESTEGKGFNGQVCIISDTVGSVLAYDMLCKCLTSQNTSRLQERRASSLSNHEEEEDELSVPGSPECISPLHIWQARSNDHVIPRRSSAVGMSDRERNFKGADSSYLSVSQGRNSLQNSVLSPRRRSSTNCCLDIQRSSSYSGPDVIQSGPIRHAAEGDRPSSPTLLKLDFEVSEFFMLGSPLGLISAMRQLSSGDDSILTSTNVVSQTAPQRPACNHIYNLFYTADPSSSRIEPLLDLRFSTFPPATVVKYQMFPLGDGQSISIGDLLSNSSEIFNESPTNTRRSSEWSIGSGVLSDKHSGNIQRGSSMHDSGNKSPDDAVFRSGLDASSHLNAKVANRWWGDKRIDYALFYPEVLSDFPSSTLPHLFHSSFWESSDVAAFVLRQVVKHEQVQVRLKDGREEIHFTPTIAREKWLRKRTAVKLRNMTSNHRARDCIAHENQPQVISGRFLYGPLDMVTLTGEKVDIYVMTSPPSSEWVHIATEVTNSHGKVQCNIPEQKRLGLGIYPVKMLVRGDHTTADCYLAVLPPQTDCVVFSIDGSFTASVSIMGSDPKVQPGAVDVVRLWQDMGYMIIYITGRPDMQKQKVVTWLAQHNFPHGLVWFGDGLSTDPLKQKANLLKSLKTDYKLNYAAGYGSSKDIFVYSQLGLASERIYIVGKTSKKQAQQSSVLYDGYSAHLSDLMSTNGIASAKFNAQIILRKGCFGLPGQRGSKKRGSKRWATIKQSVSANE